MLFALGWALPRVSLPVLTRPPVPVQAAAPRIVTAVPPMVDEVPAAVIIPAATPRPALDWSEAAVYAYAGIAFALLVRFAMGMFLAMRLRAGSISVQGFSESPRIGVPLTVGWFRPRILLPIDWRDWDRDKLHAVLAHESSHARRRDGLIAALAGVNRCIFWFHPLAWWLERRLALLAELACDESCVAVLGNRQAYASLLLDMAQVVDQSHGRLQSHALTMAATSHLRQRVESVLREGRKPSRGLSWMGWSSIALCGIPVVLGAGTLTLDHEAPLPLPPFKRFTAPAPPPPPRRLVAQVQSTSPASKARAKFEVVSIRTAAPGSNPPAQAGAQGRGGFAPPPPPPPGGPGCFGRRTMDVGRLDWACASLKELLLDVFAVPSARLVAPEWADSGRFDISAKLPEGATQEQLPEMVQSLLEDRFGLAFHRETKEAPVNALVVAKGGLKVKPAAPESAQPAWVAAAAAVKGPLGNGFIGGVRFRSIFPIAGPDGSPATVWQSPAMGFVRRSGSPAGIMHYEAPSITLEGLANLATIAGNALAPVAADMTGITGRYQLNLDVSLADLIAEIQAHPRDDAAVESAQFRIVQDGLKPLGLQLEPRRAPLETVVVDHLEKNPTAN